MQQVFREREFDTQLVNCPKCGWAAEGSEAIIIDLYGLTKNREVHCPSCDIYLGVLVVEERRSGESADPLSFQLG